MSSNFFHTRPHFEDRQHVQYSGDSITLSGFTKASHQGMFITMPTVLDFTGTTTASTTTTINGLTGYLNEGRVSGFQVYPPVLKMSGTTGTTTIDVTGMVLTALDSKGSVVWAAGASGSTDTYLSAASLNCSNNVLTLTMSDTSFYNVDFTCVLTGLTGTFTGNTSATCITDLWVSKIHSCSPLYINPLDEGNVYFGSDSGFTVDIMNGGNIYVKGDHIVHSDNDGLVDFPSLTPVFRGTLTSFDEDLTVGNIISNSNPSGNTGVFFGNFAPWPTSRPLGSLSYHGTAYTRNSSPPVGDDFYRNKIVLQGAADTSGMVIKGTASDVNSTVWWEADGSSIMLLRGSFEAYGQTGFLGLGLNPDGTELPSSHLQIGGTAYTGTFKFVDGNQQAGYVMTSDANGNVSWAPVSGGTSGSTNFWIGDSGIDSFKSVYGSHLITADYSMIGQGRNHVMTGGTQTDNVILGGNGNRMSNFTGFGLSNGMLGGFGNEMYNRARFSTILGGDSNRLDSTSSAILAGNGHHLRGNYNTILGGVNNLTEPTTDRCAIIGGQNHRINGRDDSVILGGNGITATTDSTVYVPYLNISNVGTGTSINNLGIDVNGEVVIGTSGGGGGVSIDPYEVIPSDTVGITWNVSGTSTNYEMNMTGNTIVNLSNVRNGEYGTMIVNQDAIGGRTITLGTVNGAAGTHKVVNGGGGTITLTATANATDIISFTYNGSTMYWTVGNDYT